MGLDAARSVRTTSALGWRVTPRLGAWPAGGRRDAAARSRSPTRPGTRSTGATIGGDGDPQRARRAARSRSCSPRPGEPGAYAGGAQLCAVASGSCASSCGAAASTFTADTRVDALPGSGDGAVTALALSVLGASLLGQPALRRHVRRVRVLLRGRRRARPTPRARRLQRRPARLLRAARRGRGRARRRARPRSARSPAWHRAATLAAGVFMTPWGIGASCLAAARARNRAHARHPSRRRRAARWRGACARARQAPPWARAAHARAADHAAAVRLAVRVRGHRRGHGGAAAGRPRHGRVLGRHAAGARRASRSSPAAALGPLRAPAAARHLGRARRRGAPHARAAARAGARGHAARGAAPSPRRQPPRTPATRACDGFRARRHARRSVHSLRALRPSRPPPASRCRRPRVLLRRVRRRLRPPRGRRARRLSTASASGGPRRRKRAAARTRSSTTLRSRALTCASARTGCARRSSTSRASTARRASGSSSACRGSCRGSSRAELDVGRGRLVATWDPARVELSAIARALDGLGYRPHPFRGLARDVARRAEERRMLVAHRHRRRGGGQRDDASRSPLYAGWFGHMEPPRSVTSAGRASRFTLPSVFGPGGSSSAARGRRCARARCTWTCPIALALARGLRCAAR